VLVDRLNVFLDRPVVDQTGIQGRFDIDLPRWGTPQPVTSPPGIASPPAAGANREPLFAPADPAVLMALLEDHLGLRLESTRARVDVYVVEHVERPTPN
jgi:uncharacterized protein (TIGR03435 family)